MLNLTQRLILGCVLLVGLVVGLVAVTHKALAATGQFRLACLVVVAAAVVAAGTIFFVLRPIRQLARDVRKIAQATSSPRGVEQPRQLWRDRQRVEPHRGPAARAD